MSAIYAAKYSDRIEILTDGATYDDEGRISDFSCKVWHSDRIPLAFAGRGDSATILALTAALSVLDAQDIGAAIAGFRQSVAGLRDKPRANPVDGIVAGIADDGAPLLYYFHTYEGEGKFPCEPFEFVSIENEMCLASHPAPRDYRDSGVPMFWAIDGLAEHGGRFFELLRRHPLEHLTAEGQPQVFGIGGHVDHTVLAADSVTVTRILQWPDTIGELIAP